MKTQMRKPSAGKSRYSVEYKQESVDHWKSSGRSAARVAAELGIRAPLLYRWAKQLRLAAQQGGQPELTPERRVRLGLVKRGQGETCNGANRPRRVVARFGLLRNLE